MTIFGVYNIKGGVGKTAAAVNLSYLASEEGERTLLCDLDPQGAATFYLGIPQGVPASAKKMVKGKADSRDFVKETTYPDLYMLPADLSYRKLDIHLNAADHPKKRLRSIIQTAGKRFSWIFIDSPPNITLLSENIFNAVDVLLVPVIPTTLSLRTYEELIYFFQKRNLPISRIIPFFSMVERRKKMHKELMEIFTNREKAVCTSFIPYLADIEKMGQYRKPLPAARPSSPATTAYRALWEELKNRVIT